MSWPQRRRRSLALLLATSSCLLLSAEAPRAQQTTVTPRLPAGFSLQLFADSLGSPWGMAFGADGAMYVSDSDAGRILRLRDSDGDGRADTVTTVLAGLDLPSALAWHDGELWVAEASRVMRLAGPFASGLAASPTIVVDSLPAGGPSHHSLLIEPGGRGFLLSIWASCDLCREADRRRGAIVRYNRDGSEARVWATGLRGVGGLALNAATGELWATETGRGGLGADLPPDELNAIRRGRDYGWPFCYGARIPNPEYASQARCDGTDPPILTFEAHSSPLGIAFYSGDMYPADYRGDAFVALGGSGDGSHSRGYKVVRLRVESGRPAAVEDFISGWLGERRRIVGRPLQLLVGPEGALYVSDEYGGSIWRVVYAWEDDGA